MRNEKRTLQERRGHSLNVYSTMLRPDQEFVKSIRVGSKNTMSVNELTEDGLELPRTDRVPEGSLIYHSMKPSWGSKNPVNVTYQIQHGESKIVRIDPDYPEGSFSNRTSKRK